MWSLRRPAYTCSSFLSLALQISGYLQIDVAGHGLSMGMDVTWQLKLRPDGAFLETISSKELTFQSGCGGGADSQSFEV